MECIGIQEQSETLKDVALLMAMSIGARLMDDDRHANDNIVSMFSACARPGARTLFDSWEEAQAEYDGEACRDWNMAYEWAWEYLDIIKGRIDRALADHDGEYVAVGTCGRWDGTYHGYAAVDWNGGHMCGWIIRNMMSDANDICIEIDDDGALCFEGSHHDGAYSVKVMEADRRARWHYLEDTDERYMGYDSSADLAGAEGYLRVPAIAWEDYGL